MKTIADIVALLDANEGDIGAYQLHVQNMFSITVTACPVLRGRTLQITIPDHIWRIPAARNRAIERVYDSIVDMIAAMHSGEGI